MSAIDWAIVAFYLVGTLLLGLYLSRRASGGMEDFFVGSRALPWWLAGTSMAATTFSIDTPLYVAGVVGTRGVAGNWEWWNFAIAHVILIYVFARLWSRAKIVTDNELTEIRYGGRPAAILRAAKGFLFAVIMGSVSMSLAMLAMVKVLDALEIFPALGLEVGDEGKLWLVVAVSIFVLLYAGLAGLWGVVATDFFQFFLGLLGAITVAVIAVVHVGGLGHGGGGAADHRLRCSGLHAHHVRGRRAVQLHRLVHGGRHHGQHVLRLHVRAVVGVPPLGRGRRVRPAAGRRAQ
jgi:solute:Na+ symporter, SSS family